MSLNKSQKTRSWLTLWLSATTLLTLSTTIVFSSVFINKAEAADSEIQVQPYERPPEAEIIDYYKDFLSRQPRRDEIDFRMNAYRKGYPLERQRTDIAFSDEVRQKIIGFYRKYLGRNPESGAIEFRMKALLNGRTLEQQRVDIQTSPEARSRR